MCFFFLPMEGPSIVILREETIQFVSKKVIAVSGNSKIDQQRILNQKVTDIKSWGKHFIICFPRFFLRVHFLMFGSYRINEVKDSSPRLSLQFNNGVLNMYSCSIKMEEGSGDDQYDYSTDVMSDSWNPERAFKSLRKMKERMLCDVLLDQNIFAGVGNIIKNEVLYRISLHPETTVRNVKPAKLKAMINQARNYSFDFYRWKKVFELRKHWLIYKKKKCVQCGGHVTISHTGINPRLSFYCERCQLHPV